MAVIGRSTMVRVYTFRAVYGFWTQTVVVFLPKDFDPFFRDNHEYFGVYERYPPTITVYKLKHTDNNRLVNTLYYESIHEINTELWYNLTYP